MDLAASFPPDTSSPAGARRFVGCALCGCDEAELEVVTLLTSELAANAVLHARTDFEVRIHLDEALVTVEVVDENPRTPLAADVPVDSSSGRGLMLVGVLAHRWGVELFRGGKAIWFEVPRVAS